MHQVNLQRQPQFRRRSGSDLRFDVVNVFDKIYEIRDGTGVGVGAP